MGLESGRNDDTAQAAGRSQLSRTSYRSRTVRPAGRFLVLAQRTIAGMGPQVNIRRVGGKLKKEAVRGRFRCDPIEPAIASCQPASAPLFDELRSLRVSR